jgi:hypothetical protein
MTDRNLRNASRLEDALAKDKSPTQKASKQGPSKRVSVRHQDQPNHGRSVDETDTPAKPVRGPSRSKNEYPIHFLSFTNVSVSLV